MQIGVLGTPREPFTSYQMLGLGEILAWLDSWQVPRRWRGAPAPFRQAARARSRARWALGGHFGASQVPECDSIGPGGIDIDQIASTDTMAAAELPVTDRRLAGAAPILLGPRTGHEAPSLSAAAV